jgi:hypothetical protein
MTEFVAGRIHIAGAYRVGLARVGRKWLSVVYITDGDRLTVGKLPARDVRSISPISGYESAQKLAKRLRRGRRKGQGTKTAWRLLEAAIAAD